MPVRPLSEARHIIGPYVDEIVSIVRVSHSHYVAQCGPILHALESRTKASLVRDLIVDRLRGWCDEREGVQFVHKGNLCWVGFQNNWIVRVKLMDDDFAVGVSPTESSEKYNCNEAPDSIASLLDDDEATFLYLGWRTTENAPLDPDIALVCNNVFGEPAWVWPLKGEGPPPALALPVPDAPSPGGDGDHRIRIKSRPPAEEA